ncbi:MAG TPA: acyltransferase [Phycisphaerae bacterium]|nr:acyltransferase [Phycisphaerae bacterium]
MTIALVRSPTAAAPAGTRRHVRALDGIRGLAVLLVMGHHFLMNFPAIGGRDAFFLSFLRAGWFGVDLFFVLSGYLITGILLDAKNRPHAIRNFYIRRALRIFPLYFAILAICTLLLPALFPSANPAPRAALPWLWTYTSNFYNAHGGWLAGDWFDFSHLWSLAIEEHFYLLWPWLILFVPERRLIPACITLLVTVILLRTAYSTAFPDDVNGPYLLTPFRCDGLILGGLLAMIHRTRGLDQIERPARLLLTGGTILLIAAIARFGGIPRPAGPAGCWTYTGLALLFTALVAVALTSPSLNALFSHQALRTLGKYSYALYLFHWLLRPMFLKLMTSSSISTVATTRGAALVAILLWIAATAVCTFLSWNLLERPCLALKDRWAPPEAAP